MSDPGGVTAGFGCDMIRALARTEFACADAIGVVQVSNRTALVASVNAVARSEAPSLVSKRVTLFNVEPSAVSGLAVGMARRSVRLSIISDAMFPTGTLDSIAGTPVVIGVGSTEIAPAAPSAPSAIQLVATSPQHLADLTPLAHRIAEVTLRPVILAFDHPEGVARFDLVQGLDLASTAKLLGDGPAEIETPVSEQIDALGARRRRVTVWPNNVARPARPTAQERRLIDDAFSKLSGCTRRAIESLEIVGSDDADVLVIAAGRLFKQLSSRLAEFRDGTSIVHPTLLAPLPTERLVQVIARKRAVVIAAASDDLLSYLHETLSAAIDQRIVDAAQQDRAASQKERRMPGDDRPSLHTCRVGTADPAGDVLTFVRTNLKSASPAKRGGGNGTQDLSASEESTLHLRYRSVHSYGSAAWLAERLATYVELPVSVIGGPLDRIVSLVVNPAAAETAPSGPADVMICPGRDFRELTSDLREVADQGVLFLEGSRETSDELWRGIPEPARQMIVDKGLRIVLVDPAPLAKQQMSLEDRLNGLFLGGLLRVFSGGERSVVDRSIIDRIRESLSKNGQIGFEVAVSHGIEGVVEVDISEFEGIAPSSLAGATPSGFHMPVGESDPAPDEKTLTRLLRFVSAGAYRDRRYEDCGLFPAALFEYIGAPSVSPDYPLVFGHNGGPVVPLSRIFDRLVDSVEGEGDVAAEGKRLLRKTEVLVGRYAQEHPGSRLSELWNRAAERIGQGAGSKSDKQGPSAVLASARRQLDSDGEVWPIGREAALRLAHHFATKAWKEHFDEIRREAVRLNIALTELLRADESTIEGDQATDHLQASVGKAFEADVDFDVLSRMLKDAGLSEPIGDNRRRRIATAASVMGSVPERLDATLAIGPVDGARASVAVDLMAAAKGLVRANLHDVVQLAKAIRIGRLETAGRYRDEVHDDFFARFGYEELDANELAAVPPVLVDLGDSSRLSSEARGALDELLASDMPTKVLLTTTGIGLEWEEDASMALSRCAGLQLARSAVGLNRAFVLQASLSDGASLFDGMRSGMSAPGPALFSLFEGSVREMPGLDPYLASAVAVESRLFPTFQFDPSAGDGLATQFRAQANPDPSAAFPMTKLEYESSDGSHGILNVGFSLGDVLACDVRFAHHFAVVPTEEWHDSMMQLSDVVLMDREEKSGFVPYIWMSGPDRSLVRVIVTADVVTAVRNVLDDWRLVQEMAGIDSSHVRRLLDAERDRLAEEKQEAIAQVERHFEAELDRAKGELAKEIVANIAAGLLDLKTGGQAIPTVAARPLQERVVEAAVEAPAAEAESAREPEPEPEEEEVFTLDEPYIETVRCTTCNECTQLNPRLFAYNENQQAYIKDVTAGSYRDLVLAAEKCPVRIIHPGKPRDPGEPDLDELKKRAEPFL